MKLENIRSVIVNLYDFYILSKYNSINKAAKELNVSQTTLSRSILNLEKEVNVNLINRTHNGIFLTKEGIILLEQITLLFKTL